VTETNLQKSELALEDLELPDDDSATFNGCCDWLMEEGIIRCSNSTRLLNGSIAMINPKITSKGFALLDQPFNLGTDPIRVGQAVKEIAGGRRNYAGIGDLIGGLLGGFTKSMGS